MTNNVVTLELTEEEIQVLVEYAVNAILKEELLKPKLPALLRAKERVDEYNPC